MGNNFTFQATITRARKEGDKYIIDGVASSDAVDFYDTRFNKTCQQHWKEQIESKDGMPVLLEINHDGLEDWTKRCGKINRAEIIEKTTENGATSIFEIEAEIDAEHYLAPTVYRAITNPKTEYGQPKQLAFSINGWPIGIESKKVIENGKTIEEYSKIPLFAIGIVEQAANPDANDSFINAIKRSRMNVPQNDNNNEEIKLDNENKVADIDGVQTTLTNTETITNEIKPEESNVERAAQVEVPLAKSQKEVVQDAVNELNDMVTEFQTEVLAIAKSEVSPENILFVIDKFLQKYGNRASWNLMCKGWELSDAKMAERETVKRDWTETIENIKRNIVKVIDVSEQKKVEEDSKIIVENNIAEIPATKKELKMDDEKVADVKTDVVAEVKPEVKTDANDNIMRAILASVESLKATVGELKTEVATVKAEKEKVEADVNVERAKNTQLENVVNQLAGNPVTTPANQIPNDLGSNVERELSRDEILKLYVENKLDANSHEMVKQSLTRSAYGLKI